MADDFDRIVLESMPYFVAVEYKSLLDAPTFEGRTRHAIRVYELGLRGIAIATVSQYLIRDAEKVSDPDLNHLLLSKLPFANLNTWQQIFFATLKAYEGRRSLFFMPELYDFYWDTKISPIRPNFNIESSFSRLTQVHSDLHYSGHLPTSESEWQQLYVEVISLLRTVLSHFTFLEKYDLIRITKNDANKYWYDLYRGQTVITVQQPLETLTSLSTGWFYVSKQNRDFLNLHPLLIFWEESLEDLPVASSLAHTALYERFANDNLQYLITSLWKKVTDEKSVFDFVRMLYYSIDQIKAEKHHADRLTWWKLQEIAHTVSQRRMSSILGKYRSDLYLQRDKAKIALEDFLDSNQVCFVLTGKSGVGKSNFLLALTEDYHRSHANICLLIYNGAKLSAQESLTSTVSRDFDNHLSLSRGSNTGRITNVWQEVASIKEIDSRIVLLCVDAVNENAEAKALLSQIDELVESSPWPWLKIVITSRPEAWQTMKRGLQLAEARYYRELGNEEQLGIEMEPFSYSQELTPFTRDELPLAYEKYRQAYDLQTKYSTLPTAMKVALQDPLVLRLIADIYQGQVLPLTVRISEIYQAYVDSLLKTGRLNWADLHFLERELLTRMVDEKHFANALTSVEINKAQKVDGPNLFDLIHHDGLLSTGYRVNQSYVNLVDAEILTRHGEGEDYEIGFKFERFYDHYAGKRIYELAEGAEVRERAYIDFIHQIQKHPYLWGAVKSALYTELKQGNEEMIIQLCQTEQQSVKEMMTAVLTDFGAENPQHTERILRALVQLEQNALYFTYRILFWQSVEPGKTITNAQKIAIEVAGNLGSVHVLEKAACSRSTTIRTHTVKHILYLWRRDRQNLQTNTPENRGFAVLHNLASQVKSGFVPNVHVVEACVGILLSIFAETHSSLTVGQEEQLAHALRQVTRQIMNDLLYIGEKGPTNAVIRNQIREWIVSNLVKLGLRLLRDTSTSSPANISTFFKLPRADKEILGLIIQYFDTDYKDLTALENNLPRIVSLNEGSINFQLWLVLLAQWSDNRDAVLQIIDFLFEEGMNHRHPPYACTVSVSVLATIMLQKRGDEQIGKTLLTWSTRFLEQSRGRVVHSAGIFIYPMISPYVRIMQITSDTFDTTFIQEIIERAIEEQDTDFILAVINDLGSLVTQKEHHRAVLEVVQALRNYAEPSVNENIVNLLARLRQYSPHKVDDYLIETSWSLNEQRAVRTREVTESIGADVLYLPLYFFVANAASFSPQLQKLCQEVLERLIDCHSLDEFLNILIRRILNLTYGEAIFKIK